MARNKIKSEDVIKSIAFMNGERGLDSDCEYSLKKHLDDREIKTVILDCLYKEPLKLTQIITEEITSLYILTTGMRREGFDEILKVFDQMEYVPENVIFHSENSAMAVLGRARDLKEKGTKFWYHDSFDQSLWEVVWI